MESRYIPEKEAEAGQIELVLHAIHADDGHVWRNLVPDRVPIFVVSLTVHDGRAVVVKKSELIRSRVTHSTLDVFDRAIDVDVAMLSWFRLLRLKEW